MDAPPVVKAPAHAVKGAGGKLVGKLGGHSRVVYGGVGVFAVLLFFYIRKQQAAKEAEAATTIAADGYASAGDSSAYPGSTEGAYTGTPGVGDPEESVHDGYYMTPSDIAELVYGVTGGGAPVAGVDDHAGAFADFLSSVRDLTGNVVGTAVESRQVPPPVAPPAAAAHAAPPVSVPTLGSAVVSVGQSGMAQVGAIAAPIATPGWIPEGQSPYGAKYPFHSANGWYRVVLNSKGRWHYYGPNDSPKVKV